jgi:hypothetical protein
MLHTGRPAWSAMPQKLPSDALTGKNCCCGRGRGQQRLHPAAATRAILATAAYHALLPAEARGTRAEECGGCPGCRRRSDTSHVNNLHASPPLTPFAPLQSEEPPWPLQTVLRHYSPRAEHVTRLLRMHVIRLLRMCSKCAPSSAV